MGSSLCTPDPEAEEEPLITTMHSNATMHSNRAKMTQAQFAAWIRRKEAYKENKSIIARLETRREEIISIMKAQNGISSVRRLQDWAMELKNLEKRVKTCCDKITKFKIARQRMLENNDRKCQIEEAADWNMLISEETDSANAEKLRHADLADTRTQRTRVFAETEMEYGDKKEEEELRTKLIESILLPTQQKQEIVPVPISPKIEEDKPQTNGGVATSPSIEVGS